MRQAYILPIEDKDEPGFLIDRGVINPLAEAGAGPGVYLTAPIPNASDNVPAPAAYELGGEMWTLLPPRPSAACEAGAWVSLELGGVLEIGNLSDRAPGNGQLRPLGEPLSGWGVRLEASRLYALRPDDIAFIRYQVSVGSLERGTIWARRMELQCRGRARALD